MAARKPNILVMIPAGKRYNHDNVMIYDEIRSGYSNRYFNTGDMMVYDSTLKLLDFAGLDVLKIADPSEADIERYNAVFDYVILRASNFIHEYMSWEKAEWVLDRLKIPVYAIGVGAQAETRRRIELSPESRRVWSLIAERSRAIGVRGAFSAEVLADNGIGNAEVIGCPSLFRARDRGLQIRLKPAPEIKRVAFSLRRETSQYYAVDTKAFAAQQRELLLRVADAFDTTITIHGEPEEKAFFAQDEAAIARATERLRTLGWFTPEYEPRLVELYRNRLFLNDRVEDYDAMIRQQDFAIGYRVHGILPALANGVPGLLISYDSRSSELAETFSIPTCAPEHFNQDVGRFVDEIEFGDFNSNYQANYDRFRRFLDSASIPNRM